MPLNKIIWDTGIKPVGYEQMLLTLIGEWTHPKEAGLPIIIEEENAPRPNVVRLYIIWDKWKELPRESRSKMIVEAYMKLYTGTQKEITLAAGYDVDEAIAIGLLPYKIECLLKSSDQENYTKCQEALRQLGAWERRGQLELRFANRDSAQEVYTILQNQVLGPFWAIVLELNVEDSLNLNSSVSLGQ